MFKSLILFISIFGLVTLATPSYAKGAAVSGSHAVPHFVSVPVKAAPAKPRVNTTYNNYYEEVKVVPVVGNSNTAFKDIYINKDKSKVNKQE